jgi:hypothetical protein
VDYPRIHTKFQLENLKGRVYARDIGVNENILLYRILRKKGMGTWTGFFCHGIRSSDRLMGKRQ